MKKPIPLDDFLRFLDRCPDSGLAPLIRELLTTPGLDLIVVKDKLRGAVPDAHPEILIIRALESYALHESGRLVTTAARLHHRARFYRCMRQHLTKLTSSTKLA